jgi:myosin heavy subunit
MCQEKAKNAATLIQAAWRGYARCMDYLYAICGVIMVQQMARGFLARKKVAAMRQENAEEVPEQLAAAAIASNDDSGIYTRTRAREMRR